MDDGHVLVGHVRSRDWERLGYGLHRRTDSQDQWADLLAWQQVLDDSVAFSHLTAAAVHGWWLPPLPPLRPVFVATGRGQPRVRRPQLHMTRHPTPPPVLVVEGLRVTPPATTLVTCARDLGVLDLVVLADAALREGTTREEIEVAARRRRGSPRLHRALDLADPASESAWESMLRVLHVVCDVPVTSQHEVRDARRGFVARGDLWVLGSRTLQEYDGEGHREAGQYGDDRRRERRLGAAGWRRNGYTSGDVLNRAVGILRDADEALGREHDPGRVRAWHELLRGSLFSAAGSSALMARWRPDLV
ncbi:hypothetical protein BKA08_000333 [Nocardioides marinisabuli]|uniref:Uncharacterized protein n=1 Tax=Nocardioides marinisabuli TaxID=419476 RepID=A0A7Y9JP84_9ACTN|nr:hypothetical protein [Nocardioides marinisabuli]NYD56095.1 hypothetical protein [Nocardioides marinisabuli]